MRQYKKLAHPYKSGSDTMEKGNDTIDTGSLRQAIYDLKCVASQTISLALPLANKDLTMMPRWTLITLPIINIQ